MRFRAILVVESEDLDILLEKTEKMGNFTIIDVYDSKIKKWIFPSEERRNLLNKNMMKLMDNLMVVMNA